MGSDGEMNAAHGHGVRALCMSDRDDVACVLMPAWAGEMIDVYDTKGIEVDQVKAHGDVPRFHKVALRSLCVGEPLRKYGEVIGIVSAPISRGDYVHTHNIVSAKVGVGR